MNLPLRPRDLGGLRPLLLLAALVLVFAGAGAATLAATAARVEGVRFSVGTGSTRIVFDLDRDARATSTLLKDPDRLLVDIQATPSEGLGPISVDGELVTRVRVGSADAGQTRFIIDLRAPCDHRLLTLAAADGKPDRVVVDLFALPDPNPRKPPPAPKPEPRPAARKAPAPAPVRVVVVDAGHGGADPGASAFELKEKDVCLDVARLVVQELNRRKGFRGVLTRDEDVFIPLRGRTAMADRKAADAFVSVHANAARNSQARGTEVYFLSLSGATDEASRELAELENSADERGGVVAAAEDDLSSILFDMQQTEILHRGSLLAESVVKSLDGWRLVAARGVKQAGFVVLKSPRIPSILVETAFITNPEENRLLARPEFRREMARRIASGIVDYFTSTSVAELKDSEDDAGR